MQSVAERITTPRARARSGRMNPSGQIGQEAIASMEIEMMTDLYNRSAICV